MNRMTLAHGVTALLVTTLLTGYGPAIAQMGMMGDEPIMQPRCGAGYDMPMMMGPGMGMMQGGGMMGGMGMTGGMGMMGTEPFWMLDLNDDQRLKINQIQDQQRRQHWEIMGKIMDEQVRLRDLYQADELDVKKIGEVYAAISGLHRQMLELHIQSLNQARAVLTPEQREQLKQWRRNHWGMGRMGRGGMWR